MVCSLCRERKARRACPALGQEICPVCCGTKRLVEIACPADCGWLSTSRAHPPARLQRQQDDDQRRLHLLLEGLDEGPYLVLTACLQTVAAYRASAVPAPRDPDLEDAATSLTATLETAARGVIYDHRPTSLVAARLVDAMRDALAHLQERGMSGVERDAVVALKRISRVVSVTRDDPDVSASAFFEFLGRVLVPRATDAASGEALAQQALDGLAEGDGQSRIIRP